MKIPSKSFSCIIQHRRPFEKGVDNDFDILYNKSAKGNGVFEAMRLLSPSAFLSFSGARETQSSRSVVTEPVGARSERRSHALYENAGPWQ